MGLFSWLDMIGTYGERKVKRSKVNGFDISTAAVSDNDHGFETAVSRADYNDGKWVIVEEYDTKEAASIGHNNWEKRLESGSPESLIDVSTSGVSKLRDMVDKSWRTFQRKHPKND